MSEITESHLKKPLLITLTALLLFFTPSVSHAKTFQTCTVDIPGAMTADKKGPQPLFEFYEKVIDKVSQKTGHNFEVRFAPAERCAQLFYSNQVDILWPFIIAEDPERAKANGAKELPLYSMPIIMGGYYIYTRKSDPKLNSVKELEGKTVVNARGYGVPQAMEHHPKIKRSMTNTNDLVPKMISGKRADAGIIQTGWVPILEEQGLLNDLHHGDVLDFWGGTFVFQFTQEGAALSSSFSNSILQLVNDGTYKKLMEGAPYFIPNYK
ncbi:substrate-binding periplasmic protein [Curvivirga aplysinae]|uniref:substrate-binding periplasmic protein n=1 Tax=Curvivirga aplysinae TaxID=2529852 RepID=UPI001C3FE5D5|nr:transporter substrate-binding domain-containing protein [Curvivirga aplysinae]